MLSKNKLLNIFKIILAVFLLGLLSGCGFHLRTENISTLPAELKVIKIDISVPKHTALLSNLFIDEWQQAGGTVSASDHVPVLTIDDERVIRRVLSVSPADAKVSEYSLKYVLSFKLTKSNSHKKPLVTQKIHLQRQYTVDAINVLAKEHEQAWLTDVMRQQAIKQVVRKISHIGPDILAALKSDSVHTNEQANGKE